MPAETAPDCLLSRALELAEVAHGTQTWRGHPRRRFLSHPLAVASLVLRYGGSEAQAAAALVHDACGEGTLSLAQIEAELGPATARFARAFSDPPPAPSGASPWQRARHSYLEHLAALPPDALFVIVCEELHELSELLHDLRREGPVETWKRYPANGMEYFWYFREILILATRTFIADDAQRSLVAEFAHQLRPLQEISTESAPA